MPKSPTNLPKKSQRARKAQGTSHHSALPRAFVDFMLQNWRRPKQSPVTKIKNHAHHRARRHQLSNAFPNEILVIPTGVEQFRVNDTTYPFRPGSDFFYLTGNMEPDCVLVLLPQKKGNHKAVLYVEPNPGRTDPTFFTDRHKGELWTGPRLGIVQSKQRFGVNRACALNDLPAFLKSIRKNHPYAFRLLRGFNNSVDAILPKQKKRDGELGRYLSEMRLIKEDIEIAAIKKACDSTRRGFDDIVRAIPTAKTERDLEGVFYARARSEGNDVGYSSILASGANACILHWTRNDARLKKNDLLLIDAGIEGNSLYTADITRTIPMSGTFTQAQREVYDIVRCAQQSAIDAVKPGHDFLAPHRAAAQVLAQGLVALGVLPLSAKEALLPENQFHRRYTLHGTSHMLGLDVHDCANASHQTYKDGKLKTGMVLTIEPGLYFQMDDLTVPKRYRGIGIRIEDDVLVTSKGHRLLSNVPRDADDIEDWMHTIWSAKP